MSIEPHAPRPLTPGSEVLEDALAGVRLVATDVDGTLTRGGVLHPEVVELIAGLQAAGIEVIPISGRPAGEVAGLCRYLPGVARGVAENGLIEVVPDRAPRWLRGRPDRTRLKDVGARIDAELGLGLRLTPDDPFRLGDVAYEREGRRAETIREMAPACDAQGVHLTWSNVHIHLSEEAPDKGVGLLALLTDLQIDPGSVATVGDAPNDAGLFAPGRFGVTVGTADVLDQEGDFPHLPRFVTTEREAGGFVEFARRLLQTRG